MARLEGLNDAHIKEYLHLPGMISFISNGNYS